MLINFTRMRTWRNELNVNNVVVCLSIVLVILDRGSDKDHYQRMYNFMETARPSVYVSTTKEGVRRVQKGNYAFLMESSSIEYYLERDCDLTQIGGLLDHKSYGIALQPGKLLQKQRIYG